MAHTGMFIVGVVDTTASFLWNLFRDNTYELGLDRSSDLRKFLQYAPIRRMTSTELVKVQRVRDAYFKPKSQKQSGGKKEGSEVPSDGKSGALEADAGVKAGAAAPAKRENEPADKSTGGSEVCQSQVQCARMRMSFCHFPSAA